LFQGGRQNRNSFTSVIAQHCSWVEEIALVFEPRMRGSLLALLSATRQRFNPKASLSCGEQDDFTGKGNSADAALLAAGTAREKGCSRGP
jgi:hypothetical protein